MRNCRDAHLLVCTKSALIIIILYLILHHEYITCSLHILYWNLLASSGGGSTTEKPILPPPKVVAVGTAELTVNPQAQHQITITAGSINTASENRFLRRNSFRRSPPSWFLDSRKILYLCATL